MFRETKLIGCYGKIVVLFLSLYFQEIFLISVSWHGKKPIV
ncbi:putative membrane protein [Chlamydia ibidis]|uniref:Putative membrane protein n=1 Tax=Chlamydia ibidis TaxID=1405396 RepID=S7J3B8_9CHLA|nr:putative membrane protein [Chlamydia ibidis]